MPTACSGSGQPLPDWHPLLTGTPDSVHRAGVSMRHRTVSEWETAFEEWEDHIIEEPV